MITTPMHSHSSTNQNDLRGYNYTHAKASNKVEYSEYVNYLRWSILYTHVLLYMFNMHCIFILHKGA